MSRTQSATKYLLSLLLIVVPILFIPVAGNEFEPPKAILIRFIGAILCALTISDQLDTLALKKLISPKASEWLKLTRLSTIYLAVATISTFLASDFRMSLWGSAYDHHGLITLFSCFIVALYFARNHLTFKSTAIILTLGSVPVVFYGLIQSLGFDPVIWETDSLSAILSTLGRSNFVAAYIAILLPFSVYLILQKRSAWGLWLIFFCQVLCLLLTQARAGWIAAVVGLAVLVLGLGGKNVIQRGLSIAFIGIAAVMAISSLQEWRRVVAEEPAGWHSYEELRSISIDQRFAIWEGALPLAQNAGLFGYGPEQFTRLFTNESAKISQVSGRDIIINDPHNLVLDQLISFGWIGFALFLLLISRYFFIGWQKNRPESIVLMGAMAAFLTQALFTPDIVVTQLLFWVLIGLMANPKLTPAKTTPHDQAAALFPQLPTLSIDWHAWKKTDQSTYLFIGLALFFLSIGFFMRTYQVGNWLRFTGDEARDTLAAFEVATGRYFHSKGPKIAAGFGILGPAFYYLMAIPLRIAHGHAASFGWFIALLDFCAIGMLFLLVRRFFTQRIALISAALYAVSFQVIFYARWGWHPSLVPFFIFFLLWGCLEVAEEKPGWIPVLLLTFSIALQLHLSVILFIVPIVIALWYGRKALTIPMLIFGALVMAYPFVPLLLHEINNGYPNLLGSQYLFADQSQSAWQSPLGYFINSLTTISTTQIVHKSITLIPGETPVTLLNIGLVTLGCFALSQQKLNQQKWVFFASWVLVPIIAMTLFRGFRPDYYLISWFAIPLVFAALALDWLWKFKLARSAVVLILIAIVSINLMAGYSHFQRLAKTETDFSFYYGSTLDQKQRLVNLLAHDASDTPYALTLVSWSWPNYQPHAYLLMQEKNRPTEMWMHESASVDEGPFTQHWIDTRRFGFASSKDTVPELLYIIQEPSSLPLPPEFAKAEKVGEIAQTSLYKVTLDPPD